MTTLRQSGVVDSGACRFNDRHYASLSESCAMAKVNKQRKATVKTQTRAPREGVTVNIGHDMTVHEMQLVLSRVYAIATRDPDLADFAVSLEDSLRKLVAARISRDGVLSPDPIH